MARLLRSTARLSLQKSEPAIVYDIARERPPAPPALDVAAASEAFGTTAACPLDLRHAFVLPHEHESGPPALRLLQRYVGTFCPGKPSDYAGLVSLWWGGDDWTRARHVDPAAAVRAHLAAAIMGEWQDVAGEPAPVAAVGLAFPPGARVAYLNFDLDGGIEPARFLALFRSIGARALVTSGSGKPGRYRALYRLARPLPVGEIKSLARGLCRGLGLRPKAGSIEVYPSTANGRLPFGLGGCARFDSCNPHPDERRTCTPDELLRVFRRLPPFDLEHAASEHGRPEPEPVQVSRRRESRTPTRARTPAHVSDWLAQGVNPDERLAAIAAIARDAWFRGLSESEAIAVLADWIARGGIARSNYARKGPKHAALAIADMPRQVANLYRIFDAFTDTSPATTARNLSAADLRALVPIVDAAATNAKVTSARAGQFALAMLPLFKGAKGPIRVHVSRWKAAAGGAADYRRIRDAFGLWTATSGYLPQFAAANGARAHSTSYACAFPFDPDEPRRALARTWGSALKVTQGRTPAGKR